MNFLGVTGRSFFRMLKIPCEVSHTFTHFKLILKICLLQQENCPEAGMFIRPENLSAYPVSTLMKKVYQAALKNVF